MSNTETQPGASTFDGADAWNAYQRSSGMQTPDEMAAGRYEVVRGAFWWRVKVGDGEQTVGRCYTQAEAERLAAALRTAFLDGAFVIAQQVADGPRYKALGNSWAVNCARWLGRRIEAVESIKPHNVRANRPSGAAQE